MEPQEIDSNLLNKSLCSLIFFTGLDLNRNTTHATIFKNFTESREQRPVQVKYKMLTADNALIQQRNSQKETADSPALSRSLPRGIIKRLWPHKYLNERPALIVVFVELDWDNPSWLEKRTECESKINTLRQSIGQREIRLALILIQRQQTSLEDPVAAEKAIEICQHCRISSRHLYVLPLLTDARATLECVARLEIAFHDIAQEAYQACFKRIRARNVPNNDQKLLVRQQYKLAFISELREDRHSALRYYKQAYQHCAELDVSDIDSYEVLTVASLLNYKICELNFILNSPVDALKHFRKHSTHYFDREPGVYPSRELARIELCWWKSQQCRLFAELFIQAVSNGVAAYPNQNPGRYLEEAATHYKQANSLVRNLRQATRQQQRQTPPIQSDPLHTFDLSLPTVYIGQRPWRELNSQRASSEPLARTAAGGVLAPVTVGNQQLLEHWVKAFLEQNVAENYTNSLQLYSMAVAQFKRYQCKHFATNAYLDIADEYINSHQYTKALQLLHHVRDELRVLSFVPFLRITLIKTVNVAFCVLELNEWIAAMAQLLHYELWEEQTAPATLFEEIREESWMDKAQKFIMGIYKQPFPILDTSTCAMNIPKDKIDSGHQQWARLIEQQPQHFQLNLSCSGQKNFIACQVRFLVDGFDENDQSMNVPAIHKPVKKKPILHAGELVLVEVILHNHSRLPFSFQQCSLVLERKSSSGKTQMNFENWHNFAGSGHKKEILIPSRGKAPLFFTFKPIFGQTDIANAIDRAQSPSSFATRNEIEISISKFSIGSCNGSFFWEFTPSANEEISGYNNDQSTSSTIRVLPQLKKLKIEMPVDKIQLFADEQIDIPIKLINEDNGTPAVDLKNIRVLCQKVYQEEDAMDQNQLNTMAEHKFKRFAANKSTDSLSGYTLVPLFNQEVAHSLTRGESTNFSVPLQSKGLKSKNCVALQIQTFSLRAQDDEPVEWTEIFPINCVESFNVKIAVYSENGETAEYLIKGQYYKIEIAVEPASGVELFNIEWKFNSPLVEIPPTGDEPLAATLTKHFKKWAISNGCTNVESKYVKNTAIFEEIWIKISDGANQKQTEDPKLALGDVMMEWKGPNSRENVRSLLNLGHFPLQASPLTIKAKLFQIAQTQTAGNAIEDYNFVVGRPIGLHFTIRNSWHETSALAIHFVFDQTEGFIYSGTKEDNFTLFPDESHSMAFYLVPIQPGNLQFPKPIIKYTTGLNGEEEFSKLTQMHISNSFPAQIFVMP